jgi:predicted N-acetyltransferase YhbS
MKTCRIIRHPESVDLVEIAEFLSRIFLPNYHHATRTKQMLFKNEPSTLPVNFILARDRGGELAGVVRIVERTLLIEGIPVDFGFIASVGVAPSWRGQNVASRMINAAFAEMTSRGIPVSAVHGRRGVDGFYSKFGYYGIARYGGLEIVTRPQGSSTIKTAYYKQADLNAIHRFYQNNYYPLSGTVKRNRRIWGLLLHMEGISGEELKLMLLKAEGKTVGYLVRRGNSLIELAMAKKYFKEMPVLLNRLGIKTVSIHPLHPFFRYLRSNYNTVYHERFALDGGYMAKILNHELYLNLIIPLLKKRAETMGLIGAKLNLCGHVVDLARLKVGKSSNKYDLVFKNKSAGVQLLLGVNEAEYINGLQWKNGDSRMGCLFPSLYFHSSSFDEV